jgi:hypothetical protein
MSVVPHTTKQADDAGKYLPLYKYLRDRFSDRLVLTFGQIEDLLGFSLPSLARVEREWWANTESASDRSRQSDAWVLAGRTASVNLSAQCVTFERETRLGSRRDASPAAFTPGKVRL